MTRATFLFLLFGFYSSPMISEEHHRGPRVPPARLISARSPVLPPAGEHVPYPSSYSGGPGDSIGFTVWDYLTNGSIPQNVIWFGDGAVAISQVASSNSTPTSRRTYYKYSPDGTSWTVEWSGVESIPVWGGSIDQFSDADGTEIIVSTSGESSYLSVDAARGAGVWSEGPGCVGMWARCAVSSPFFVHIIGTIPEITPARDEITPAQIVYCRSPDAGGSIDIVGVPLFTRGKPDADGYDIAAWSSKVSVVSAGRGGDVVLVTSTNNGSTWTEQVIYDVRDGEGELPPGEKEFQPDGSCSILYDTHGNVHIAWANYLAIGDQSGTARLYYSQSAPIMYWSEATGIENAAHPLRNAAIEPPIGRDGNYASQPDLCEHADGIIVMIYSQVVEERDIYGHCYEHIYLTGRDDVQWYEEQDAGYDATGYDATFASIARYTNDDLHIVYHADPFAGNAASGDYPWIQTAVMYYSFYPFPIPKGTPGVRERLSSATIVSSSYPNPFNSISNFKFRISNLSDVSLKIFNLLGEEVATLVSGQMDAGTHTVQWDATAQPSGVYFYRLKAHHTDGGQAGDFVETRKLVLMR